MRGPLTGAACGSGAKSYQRPPRNPAPSRASSCRDGLAHVDILAAIGDEQHFPGRTRSCDSTERVPPTREHVLRLVHQDCVVGRHSSTARRVKRPVDERREDLVEHLTGRVLRLSCAVAIREERPVFLFMPELDECALTPSMEVEPRDWPRIRTKSNNRVLEVVEQREVVRDDKHVLPVLLEASPRGLPTQASSPTLPAHAPSETAWRTALDDASLVPIEKRSSPLLRCEIRLDSTSDGDRLRPSVA